MCASSSRIEATITTPGLRPAVPRKALLLGRNDDHSLRWCCNYDDTGADRHGLSPCDVRKIRNALEHRGYKVNVVGPDCRTEGQIIDAVKDAMRDCAEEDHFR